MRLQAEKFVWLTFTLYIVHLASFNWWADFFQYLQSSHQSYRFMQIWVQADQACAPFVRPIGASLHEFQQWSAAIRSLLKQADRYQISQFQYQLYLDRPTFIYHQDFLHQLMQYPQFQVSFVEDLMLDPITPLHEGFIQCSCGIPALCSDLVRISQLHHSSFDYNLYMDIDTFIYRLKYRAYPTLPRTPLMSTSDHVFGLHAPMHSISHSFSFLEKSATESAIETNNDFIVSYLPDPALWTIVHHLAEDRYHQVSGLFDLLAGRQKIDSFPQYQYHLEQKILWALNHPDQNVNPIPLVIETTGPGFWKDLDLRSLTQPYLVMTIPSSGGWMNRLGSVYGHISVHQAQLFYPQDSQLIEILLKLNFMSHDYQYYRHRHVDWLPSLKKEMDTLWNQLTPNQKDVGKFLFRSSFEWIEDEQDDQ